MVEYSRAFFPVLLAVLLITRILVGTFPYSLGVDDAVAAGR